MFETIAEMFSYGFIVRAFIVGTLVSLCAALLGVTLVLKRYSMIGDGLSHVAFGAIAVAAVLNMTNRTLEKNGERVKLTQLEYSIMKLFMENRGKALAREEILDAVWGKGYFGELKIVDVNVRRLRIKIEDDAQEPKYISTVWGYGYKWTV